MSFAEIVQLITAVTAVASLFYTIGKDINKRK